MGLDMYLEKETYIWQRDRKSMASLGDLPEHIQPDRVTKVVENVGYWRKANAIHRWFVDEIQDGNDNCGRYYVPEDKLMELLSTVEYVLENIETEPGQVHAGTVWTKTGGSVDRFVDGQVVVDSSIAHELLPTTGGFFFGGTDYDGWYVQGLEHTADIIREVLADPSSYKMSDISYTSSW